MPLSCNYIDSQKEAQKGEKMFPGLFKVLQKCLIREVPVLFSVPVKLIDTSQQAPLPQPGTQGLRKSQQPCVLWLPHSSVSAWRAQPARAHSTSCCIFFFLTVQAGTNSNQFLWDLKAVGEESPWASQIMKSCHTNKRQVDLKRHQDVSLFSVPFLAISYMSRG